MESFLHQNQEQFAARIKNAAKFAGMIGKGKKALDAAAAESPQEYLDYQWFKTDLVTTMSNSIKQMEKLSSDQEQRSELKNTWEKATEGMDIDPKGAVKLLYMTFDTMGKIAKSVVGVAEPVHKGVMYGLNGIPEDFGTKDYISTTVTIRTPDGRIGSLPEDELDAALKLGATQVKQ